MFVKQSKRTEPKNACHYLKIPKWNRSWNGSLPRLGRARASYVEEALAEYPDTRTDYRLALAALEKEESHTSLADVRRELGLER